MDLPVLLPDESWLMKSEDVYIRSAPFAAFLTTSRIILHSAGSKRKTNHILSRGSVTGVHAATSEFGEPVLSLEIRYTAGEMRKIVMNFSGRRAGALRTGERDQWVRILSGTTGPEQNSVPEHQDCRPQKQPTESQVPSERRNLIFHAGIHEHSATRPIVPHKETGISPEESAGDPLRETRQPEPKDRPGEPNRRDRESCDDPKNSRPRSTITVRDRPDGGSTEGPVCRYCGKTLRARSRFCSCCGEPVPAPGEGAEALGSDRIRRTAGKNPAIPRTGSVKSPEIRFIDPPGRVPVGEKPDPYGIPHEFGEIRTGRNTGGTVLHSGHSRIFTGHSKTAVVAILLCAAVLIVAAGGMYLPFAGGKSTGGKAVAPASLQKNAEVVPVTSLPAAVTPGAATRVSADSTGLPTLTTLAASSSGAIDADPISQDLNFILSCKCGVYVRVDYPGSWSGTYGVNKDTRSAQYSGEKIFQIENAQGTLSALFQKEDASGQKLLVEIYNNGKIVGSGSSTDPKGTVAITADV
jgi:hypothetical protein